MRLWMFVLTTPERLNQAYAAVELLIRIRILMEPPTALTIVPMIRARQIRVHAVVVLQIPIRMEMEHLIATMNVHWIRERLYLAYVVAV